MAAVIGWFWKNIFILGMIAIEGAICIRRPRRRFAMPRGACFAVFLLAASSLLTRTWEWEGDLIQRDNILINSAWRIMLVYLSALQLLVCFDMDIWNALLATQAAAACQTAQFSGYKLMEALLLGAEAQRAPGIASVLLNLAVLAGACVLIYLFFGQKSRLTFGTDRRGRYAILLAALLNLADIVLNGLLYTTDPNANFGLTMMAMRLYSLLYNSVTLYMLYNLIVRRAMEREQDVMRSMMETRENQYRFSKELIESVNMKAHDLKKQIRYLKSADGEHEDFLNEMESLANAYDATIRTGNAALTAILTEKSLLCLEKKIPFSFSDGEVKLDFMRGIDVYTLFANLMDNAMEATEQLPEGHRSIQLIIRKQFEMISIHCENSFSGRLNESEGVLRTLKPDAESHGYGYRSMEEIAERYGGSISHRAQDGIFVVNILLPAGEEDNAA